MHPRVVLPLALASLCNWIESSSNKRFIEQKLVDYYFIEATNVQPNLISYNLNKYYLAILESIKRW